jgi:hypothetical protein
VHKPEGAFPVRHGRLRSHGWESYRMMCSRYSPAPGIRPVGRWALQPLSYTNDAGGIWARIGALAGTVRQVPGGSSDHGPRDAIEVSGGQSDYDYALEPECSFCGCEGDDVSAPKQPFAGLATGRDTSRPPSWIRRHQRILILGGALLCCLAPEDGQGSGSARQPRNQLTLIRNPAKGEQGSRRSPQSAPAKPPCVGSLACIPSSTIPPAN